LPYLDANGRERTVKATGGVVKCTSVLANLNQPDLLPPPGPVRVIVEDKTLLWVGLVLALLLLTAAVALATARFLRGRDRIVVAAPVVPAEVIARGRLQTLRAKDLAGRGLVKEFYLELSHILREYFGNRYAVNALEMTTTEALDFLTEERLMGIPRDVVAGFLDESDLVKFARYAPTEEETAEVFRVAEEIVACTTPAEPDPMPEGEATEARVA
jgi:hypothetical protein